MTAVLLPNGKQSYATSAGIPLVGGKVFTYDTGTTNPRITWSDAAQVAPNANPVILDARGEASIFWSGNYRVVLQDSLGNVIWQQDGVQGVAPGSASLIPSTDNAFTLGSPTFAWAQLYLGAGHLPALDTVGGNIGYYRRTAAEIAAGVTPTSFSIPSHEACGIVLMERYGGAGDNLTINDVPFNRAQLVAGQLDAKIGFSQGTASVWLFSSPWVSPGTVQGYGGSGPIVPAAGTIGCRFVGTSGRPRIKFSGIGAGVDCVTLGGANLPQVQIENLEFDFNTTGRDGMVILGSNKPIILNVMRIRAQRDSFVLSPNGTSLQWIEKGLFSDQDFECGRHAIRVSLQGGAGTNPYVNENLWLHSEVRGISRRYAGGNALFHETVAGLGGAAKTSDNVWMKTVWDCIYPGSGFVPDVSPVRNDSGVMQNNVFINAAWENTSGVSPGVGYAIRVSGTGIIGGITMLASLTNSFWGSNGLDPAISQVFDSDFSFNRTRVMAPLTLGPGVGNTPLLLGTGNTTAHNVSDFTLTRTGAHVGGIGRATGINLGNLTTNTFMSMQEENGDVVFYTFAAGAWAERVRISQLGAIRLNTLSYLYGVTAAPGAGFGNNGDFAFNQNGGGGTSIYMKRAGAWVGIV